MTSRKKQPEAEVPTGSSVWVCVHCGYINPSKPGKTCPHYQLAYFESLEGETLEAVERLSLARKTMHDELKNFNTALKNYVEQGKARIEPASKLKKIDLYTSMAPEEFSLERQEAKPPPPAFPKKHKPQPKKRAPKVDPRQLVLLDFMPEGEA